MTGRLSAGVALCSLALIGAAAYALCTLAGLRPMTAVISGSLPDATSNPALAALLGALYAACHLGCWLFAPAFVIAAAMLTAWNALGRPR